MHKQKRVYKKEFKQKEKEKNFNLNFQIKEIEPITNTQQKVFNEYDEDKHLVLYGAAGSGKTFLSIYLALDDIINEKTFTKLIIIRSAVQSRNIGFMPGSLESKTKLYEDPYIHIVNNLFERDDAYFILKQKKIIEFKLTTFLRGLTLDNCILLVDEFQNMNIHEINTLITRLGENSKIMFCGDSKQTDLKGDVDFNEFIKRVRYLSNYFSTIEFTNDDICRSGLVKEWYKLM